MIVVICYLSSREILVTSPHCIYTIVKQSLTFVLVTEHNLGNHFLNWSLYFLNGISSYYNNGVIASLTSNPLGIVNCHTHNVNMLYGYKELSAIIDNIPPQPNHININFTMISFANALTQCLPDIELSKITPGELKTLHQYRIDDLNKAIAYISEKKYQIMCIMYNNRDVLGKFYNNRNHVDCVDSTHIHNNMDGYMKSYENNFFKTSGNMFNSSYIWDIREKYALNITPFDVDMKIMDKLHFPSMQSFNLDSIDIFDNLDKKITGICAFYDISIDMHRYERWKSIYNDWKRVHDTKFSREFWQIIDAIIVNENNIDLSKYNMDFYKEVLILYGLMYKYDMNLKSWKLTKFPRFTRELSLLVEDNIHNRTPNFDNVSYLSDTNYY